MEYRACCYELYTRSESCVRLPSRKSNTFQVGVGLQQGGSLSPIAFVIFMDGISRHSRGEEGVLLWTSGLFHSFLQLMRFRFQFTFPH